MTLIMSELGFVYFFGRAAARKAVAVYFVSLVPTQGMNGFLHRARAHLLEHFPLWCILLPWKTAAVSAPISESAPLDSPDAISASYLEVQKVVRAQLENYFLQGGFVRFQEKELFPVPLGLLMVFLILQSGQRIEGPPRLSFPSPPWTIPRIEKQLSAGRLQVELVGWEGMAPCFNS
jgi:hypothetical protein